MIKFDLSEIPVAPTQYRIAGAVLLGAGILLLILGLIFATFTVGRRAANNNRVKLSAEDCVQKIKALNLDANADNNMIRIHDGNLKRGMELLASSSQAAGLCPNWTLNDYCLGDGCAPPGLTMSLKFSEKK